MTLLKSEIKVLNFSSRSSTLVLPEASCEEKYSPDMWTLCVHPQGWIYFHSCALKVVTNQDVRDPGICELVTRSTANYPLPDLDDQMEVQLLVSTDAGQQGMASLFLVINHKHCVASYDLREVKDENVHLLDPNTLNRRRRLYWNYLWNHPSHVPTPTRAIPDASDALTWYFTDNLISGSRSLAPFSKTECEDLSKVLRQMSESCNDSSVAKTVFLAWLLREVCSFRDSEHYGQYTQKASQALREARKHAPGHSKRRPPPWVMPIVHLVINLFFFGIPSTYYAHVKSSSEYRGRLANVQQNWEKYIERLVREYSHFLLVSTVLLSATVGLLAIPEIHEPARVSATISSLASLGSIIVGVFSIWRHQTNTRTADSFTYMHNAQRNYLGLYGHAMLLSLPPVLLVWAIITFTVSIVAYAVQGFSGVDPTHSSSAWVVIGIFVVLLAAVFAALYTFSIIWKFKHKAWRIQHWKALWNRRRTHSTNAILPKP
ncbi:hypothetical protein LshimejAT787_0105600 [Lyophyllum shimeji]|uniref:Uncharacterized protein n=1 Tax=Lyophyllum shimeji TaxID=47721 RepID=A0A9P3PDW8_LYOSH|nr:hypothetical protein LshimejAT787_0105600 [Lyophyllum shimeji]